MLRAVDGTNRSFSVLVLVALASACTTEPPARDARAALDARFLGPEQWFLPPGPATGRTAIQSIVLTDDRLVIGGGEYVRGSRSIPDYSWWSETDASLRSLQPLELGRTPLPVALPAWGAAEALEVVQRGDPHFDWVLRRYDDRGVVAEELAFEAAYAAVGWGPAGWVLVSSPLSPGGWPLDLVITPIGLDPIRLGTPHATGLPYADGRVVTAGTETHQVVQVSGDAGTSLAWFDASLGRVAPIDGSTTSPLLCGRHHCLTGAGDDVLVWTSPDSSVRLDDPGLPPPGERPRAFAALGDRFVRAWVERTGSPSDEGILRYATLSAADGVGEVVSHPTTIAGLAVAVGREERAVVLSTNGDWDVGPWRRSTVVVIDGEGAEVLPWTLPGIPEMQIPRTRAHSHTSTAFVVDQGATALTLHPFPEAIGPRMPTLLWSRPERGRYGGAGVAVRSEGRGWGVDITISMPVSGPPIRWSTWLAADGAVGGIDDRLPGRADDYAAGARHRLIPPTSPGDAPWSLVEIDARGHDVGDSLSVPATDCADTWGHAAGHQMAHDLWLIWCEVRPGWERAFRLVRLPVDGAPEVTLIRAETFGERWLAGRASVLFSTWEGEATVEAETGAIALPQSIAGGGLLVDVGHDGRAWIVATIDEAGTITIRWLDDLLTELDRIVLDDLPTAASNVLVAGAGGVTTVAYARADEATVAVRAAFRTIVRPGEDGVVCATDTACTSGHCIDGICCDTACGACGTCSGERGPIGTCVPVPAGLSCREAATACDDVEVCDGTSVSCPESEPVECLDGGADAGAPDAGATDVSVADGGADAPTTDVGSSWYPTGGGDCRCAVGSGVSPPWASVLGWAVALAWRRRARRRRRANADVHSA